MAGREVELAGGRAGGAGDSAAGGFGADRHGATTATLLGSFGGDIG